MGFVCDKEQVKDIRRFSVPRDVCTSFEYLDGKIRSVVLDLIRKDLHISWRDEEGDKVTISCDDELNTAVQAIPRDHTCLKIYVRVKDTAPEKEHDEEHP